MLGKLQGSFGRLMIDEEGYNKVKFIPLISSGLATDALFHLSILFLNHNSTLELVIIFISIWFVSPISMNKCVLKVNQSIACPRVLFWWISEFGWLNCECLRINFNLTRITLIDIQNYLKMELDLAAAADSMILSKVNHEDRSLKNAIKRCFVEQNLKIGT